MPSSTMLHRLNRARPLILAAAILAAAIAYRGYAAEPVHPSLPPAEALQMLLDGNARFAAGKPAHPNQSAARRDTLTGGQHPFAAILSCSDSRVGPEIVFDRGLGDLFVVRVAGNVADTINVESLGYAVAHLGVRLVVVLGHTKCGAVTAAVRSGGRPTDVPEIVSAIEPAVAAAKSRPGDLVENAIRENVRLVIRNLSTSGPLAAGVKTRQLRIAGGVYDLATGKVEILKN